MGAVATALRSHFWPTLQFSWWRLDPSYTEFEMRYLDRAQTRTKGSPRAGAAEWLLRETHASIDPARTWDEGYVIAELDRRWRLEQLKMRASNRTASVVELLLGEEMLSGDEVWIEFAECLERLKPLLQEMPLIPRLICALRVLGLKNRIIADLIDRAVTAVKPLPLESQADLEPVPPALVALRSGLLQALPEIQHKQWVEELIGHKHTRDTEWSAWLELERLAQKPLWERSSTRAQRSRTLDDRLKYAKSRILQHLSVNDFVLAGEK